MSQQQRLFFSGDTVEQAVLSAARHYGVDPERLLYQRVEKRHGFVKRRRVVIRVDPDQPEQLVDAPEEDRPAAERVAKGESGEPRSPEPGEGLGESEPTLDLQPPEQSVAPPQVVHQEEEPESVTHEAARSPAREPKQQQSGEVGGSVWWRTAPSEAPARAAEKRPEPEGRRRLDRPDSSEPQATARRERGGRQRRAPAARSIEPLERRFEEASGELAEAANRALDTVLGLAKLRVERKIFVGDDRLEIDLTGLDRDLLIEDDGQAMLAVQHLLPRLMEADLGRIQPCRVDSELFQEMREERLRKLALRVADDVRERRRSKTLRPMNPADRRIIHVALADESDVTTESIGNGYYKRVSVRSV